MKRLAPVAICATDAELGAEAVCRRPSPRESLDDPCGSLVLKAEGQPRFSARCEPAEVRHQSLGRVDDGHPVRAELDVGAHQRQALHERLGDDEAFERVAVKRGQTSDAEGVG